MMHNNQINNQINEILKLAGVKLNEQEDYLTLYRGFDKQYKNLGIPNGSNHIWTTDDLEYAQEYYDTVAEIQVPYDTLNIANDYDLANIFEDYDLGDCGWIDFGNEEFEKIKQEGYNCFSGELPNGSDVYVLLDKSLIKSSKILDESKNKQLNEISKQEYLSSKQELGNNMLYHGTTLLRAYLIFETNCIKGRTCLRFDNPANYIGVSTSRSYQSSIDYVDGYVDEMNHNNHILSSKKSLKPIIVFAFDKQQLKEKHKIIPYDYFGDEKNSRLNGTNEREEVVVGDIKNVRDITQKIILNNDAKKLLDKGELAKFLLIDYYRDEFVEDESSLYESIIREGFEFYSDTQYDEEKECYIDKNGKEIYDDEIFNKGIEILIKRHLSHMDEFITFIKNKLANLKLNEEIIYAETDAIDDTIYRDPDLRYVILKNPTRKEFKENDMTFSRWCYDNNNFYFCDAYDLTHEKMESILSNKGIFTEDMMGFYDYYKNTISCRDDYDNDPELKEEYRQSMEKSLKKIDYFNKTFGDFKYDNFETEYPNGD